MISSRAARSAIIPASSPTLFRLEPPESALAASKEIPYLSLVIHSRLTSKSQTTVPRAVRIALGLKPGDEVAWEIDGGRATVRRLSLVDPRDPFVNNFSTFTEWADEFDSVFDDL